MTDKVAVFGGTGLIGRSLIDFLIAEGYDVTVFTRNIEKAKTVFGGKINFFLNEDMLTGALANHEIIINLAGEPISKRWTEFRKRQIRDSRINFTSDLIKSINTLEKKPRIYIQGSATGYYPFSSGESFTERSGKGNSFLSETVSEWEAAAGSLDKNVRKLIIRTGVVLSSRGGMLPKITAPLKWFLGAIPGRGRNWISWIHIQDLVSAVMFLINNRALQGVFNMCSSEPVMMKDLVSHCGRILKRPVYFRIPEFVIRLLFGRMGEETVLSSQKVIPEKLSKSGFRFRFPDIRNALDDLLSRN